MSGSQAWAQAFNISSDTLQKWSRSLQAGESLLLHALTQGHIDSKQYLTWARDHYGLVSLGEEFFNLPADQELWKQIQGVGSWTESMVPIRFWDNVVFVLVCEPPSHIQWSFPVQYLLADPRSIKRYWLALQNPKPVETSTEVSTKASTEVSIQPPSDLMPEGLSLNLPPSPKPDSPPPQPDTEVEAPVGLSLAPKFTLNLNLDVPVGLAPDVAPGVAPEPAIKTPSTTAHHTEPLITPTPVKSTTASSGSKSSSQSVQVAAPADISMANTDEEALAWTFAQVGPHYERSMALIFDGKLLRLWKHDGRWTLASPKAESQPIDSEKPSLFRILRRTSLPYHGRVADSPTHQEFFSVWNQGQVPPHATAVPLKMAGQLIGMILAVGGEAANSERALKIAETATEKLGERLDQVGLKAA